MSRIAGPVSQFTRSMGTTASKPFAHFSGKPLSPKYAELLRNRKMPLREQPDVGPLRDPPTPAPKPSSNNASSPQAHSHARQMTTHHVPPPPQTNPIHLPSFGELSSTTFRTPVPITFNLMKKTFKTRAKPHHAPDVVVIAQNPKDKLDVETLIESIDVDDVALKKASV